MTTIAAGHVLTGPKDVADLVDGTILRLKDGTDVLLSRGWLHRLDLTSYAPLDADLFTLDDETPLVVFVPGQEPAAGGNFAAALEAIDAHGPGHWSDWSCCRCGVRGDELGDPEPLHRHMVREILAASRRPGPRQPTTPAETVDRVAAAWQRWVDEGPTSTALTDVGDILREVGALPPARVTVPEEWAVYDWDSGVVHEIDPPTRMEAEAWIENKPGSSLFEYQALPKARADMLARAHRCGRDDAFEEMAPDD